MRKFPVWKVWQQERKSLKRNQGTRSPGNHLMSSWPATPRLTGTGKICSQGRRRNSDRCDAPVGVRPPWRGEGKRNPNLYARYVHVRAHLGICNTCHLTTFCQCVETILGTEVPPRGKIPPHGRAGLNRLHSHMLLYGDAGLEIGFETLFQYAWRDREAVMDLIEMLTGNRVNQSYITIGGVKHDITEIQINRIKPVLADLEQKMGFYKDLYANDASLHLRTKNIGVLNREDALKLCVVGPVARAVRGSDRRFARTIHTRPMTRSHSKSLPIQTEIRGPA